MAHGLVHGIGAGPVLDLAGVLDGEGQRVDFLLTAEQLGFWNREMRFTVEPGEFKVMVGPNSEDLLEATFEIQNR